MKKKEINILQVLKENVNSVVPIQKLVADYDSTWQKKQTNDKFVELEIRKLQSQGHTIKIIRTKGYKLVVNEIKTLF